ncbi:hypothetical protein FBU30_010141, partial [Linnemannia zychae]
MLSFLQNLFVIFVRLIFYTRPLRVDIFPNDISPPKIIVDLPDSGELINNTIQLVSICYLLEKNRQSSPSSSLQLPAPESDDLQDTHLNKVQLEWIQHINDNGRDKVDQVADQLVSEFTMRPHMEPAAIDEIVYLSPILNANSYRILFNFFVSSIEKVSAPVNVHFLQGLIQLVECRSERYLVNEDLISVARKLTSMLVIACESTSNFSLHLILALSRVVDIMRLKIDESEVGSYQSILGILKVLKDNENMFFKFYVSYVSQAIQYALDAKASIQTLLGHRHATKTTTDSISSAFKMVTKGFLNSMLARFGLNYVLPYIFLLHSENIDNIGTLFRHSDEALEKSGYHNSHVWYLVLQETALLIRQGRLSEFNKLICLVSCRNDTDFWFGICYQLGEIAADPLWDILTRQQAVNFLGELYHHNIIVKKLLHVKRWILTLLIQISGLRNRLVSNNALVLVKNLKQDGITEFLGSYPISRRPPLPRTFPLLASIQEMNEIEHKLQTLQKRRMNDYKDPFHIPPMARRCIKVSDKNLFILMDDVKAFLSSNRQVMLILGDSGAGKSAFNRYLEYVLWKEYSNGGPIPLLINLPAINQPDRELIVKQLKIHDFSAREIRKLKQSRQFVLICDGYDEGQLNANLHTTNLFHQSGQFDVKLLITCRIQYLCSDYRDQFTPMSENKYHQAANNLFQEATIAPFSTGQIGQYIEKYVPLMPHTWATKDYMDNLKKNPNLMELVRNPFLLRLAIEALPNLIQDKIDLSRHNITWIELYGIFVEHWIRVNKRRLQDKRLDKEVWRAFEELKNDGFQQCAIDFQKRLALEIFREQKGQPIVEYIPKDDKLSWKAMYFSSEPRIEILREVSILTRVGAQYRYMHRSILEYFFSNAVWDAGIKIDKFCLEDTSASNSKIFNISDHPLSIMSFVKEHSIIHFLAEMAQADSSFRQHLLHLIELSKTDIQASQAAANAITVLVKARVRFNGFDYRGIRIPGADLSNGQFDSTQFQDADLTDVNFTMALIRQTNFSGARLEGVQFGELPYIRTDDVPMSIAFSPDGTTLAVGLLNGNIELYETTIWTKNDTFSAHQRTVVSLSYSPSGDQILSCSQYEPPRLWDTKTISCNHILEGYFEEISLAVFSPCSKHIVTAGKGTTMRIWDAQTGLVLLDSISHTEDIIFISFLPDSQHIISGSHERLRIFNIHTGDLVSTLETENMIIGVRSIAYSPDGLRFFTGYYFGFIQFWESNPFQPGPTWYVDSKFNGGINFSPNGQWLVLAGRDYTVKMWDGQNGTLVSTYYGHTDEVHDAKFTPTGTMIASASEDGTVRLWEANRIVTGLNSSGPSDTILSSVGDQEVTKSESEILEQYIQATDDILFLVENRFASRNTPAGHLCAVCNNSKVIVWDINTGNIKFVLWGHESIVSSVDFSPCGRWIATGGYDSTIRVWEARSGIPVQIFSTYPEQIVKVMFSPSGYQIVSRSKDGEVMVCDVETGDSRVLTKRKSVVMVEYSPRGGQIAVWCEGTNIELYDDQTYELQHTLKHDGHVRCMIYSPCGRWMAVGIGRSLWLWNCVHDMPKRKKWYKINITECYFKEFGFNHNEGISWTSNPLEFKIGFLGCGTSIWRVEDDLRKPLVKLVWTDRDSGLIATDALIVDTIGLSAPNR